MTALQEMLVRRNPAYELVEYSLLAVEAQEALRPLRSDPDFFGVLRPFMAGPTIRAVCRSTAVLWNHLSEPGPIPGYLLAAMDAEELRRGLTALLSTGVIQRWDGAEWTAHLDDARDIAALTTDALSRAALVDAAQLVCMGEDDPLWLSSRLYGFHHEPLDPGWRRSVTTTANLLAAVGMNWTPDAWSRTAPAAGDPWVRWSPLGRRRARWKVYVAPSLDAAGGVLPVVARAAVAVGAAGFKIGGTPRGLARPDRFIVYLTDRAQVDDLLKASVSDLRGRGVPFTAPLDGGKGMFSLGADSMEASVTWLGGSWRRWLTDRLAGAMVRAGSTSSVNELLAAAAAEAARAGVDTSSWTLSA